MRVLFLLFAIMPIIEIALLIKVGGIIGGWNTVAIVLLTAFIGAYFVKREGLQTMQTAQEKMQRGEMPGTRPGHISTRTRTAGSRGGNSR